MPFVSGSYLSSEGVELLNLLGPSWLGHPQTYDFAQPLLLKLSWVIFPRRTHPQGISNCLSPCPAEGQSGSQREACRTTRCSLGSTWQKNRTKKYSQRGATVSSNSQTTSTQLWWSCYSHLEPPKVPHLAGGPDRSGFPFSDQLLYFQQRLPKSTGIPNFFFHVWVGSQLARRQGAWVYRLFLFPSIGKPSLGFRCSASCKCYIPGLYGYLLF